jgi:pimeloyl-ACP methyl ester carboxylesterase
VRAVGGEAPWVDLEKVIRLVTTGYYGRGRYASDPYAQLAVARSLAAGLPQSRDRKRLLTVLHRTADDEPDPLAPLRSLTKLRRDARSLVSLLLNRDAARFATLYRRLPQTLRRDVALLSPLLRARRLDVPVELASSPRDDYFPPDESRSLARRSTRVHVTVTSALDHALPRLTPRAIGELAAFDRFVVRFLRDAR